MSLGFATPLALTLALALALTVFIGGKVSLAQEVTLFATYRDMLPCGCMTLELGVRTVPFAADYLDAWNITSTGPGTCRGQVGTLASQFCTFTYSQDGAGDCNNAFVTEAWMDKFMDGTISGHPDFEFDAGFVFVGSVPNSASPAQSTVTQRTGPFPIGACAAAGGDETGCNANYPNGALTRIVKDDLVRHKSGLFKMDYCESGPDARCGGWKANTNPSLLGAENGFANGEGPMLHQTRKKYFDSWFLDDEKYNKRIGQTLKLKPRGGGFVFDSLVDDENEDFTTFTSSADAHFGPLDRFKDRSSLEYVDAADYPNPLDAPAWPNLKRVGINKEQLSFLFTTEIHASFKYVGGEQLSFFGDDDMWVFINGKMALDVGGWHEALQGTVDVTSFESELGLVIGETYELDLYHAERHHGGSNFKLTTTLLPGCNVQESGTKAFESSTEPDLSAVLQTSRSVDLESNKIILLQPEQFFVSSHAWTNNQFNLGTGFQITFDVAIGSNETQGFALVAHRRDEGLVNLPVSLGKNLNMKGLAKSFALLFDLCATNVAGCTREVSLHYPDSPETPNNVQASSKRVNDDVVHNLKPGRSTSVFVQYLQDPDWLEVYMDNSLYLRQKNFSVDEVTGGRNAHLGFTTSSGETSTSLEISNLVVTTVSFDASKTVIEENVTAQELLADGISISEGVKAQSRDFCENNIEFSDEIYRDNNIGGYYVLEAEASGRRRLDPNATVIPAVVVDNEDGTYSLALRTTVVGDFSLFAWSGDPSCDYNVVGDSVEIPVGPTGCVYMNASSLVSTVPLTPSPTVGPTSISIPPTEANNDVVTLAAAGGSVLGVLSIFALILLSYRRKWQKDKDLIEEGNLYKLDAQTKFDPSNKLNVVGRQVLTTTTAILGLTARSKTTQQEELVSMMNEQEELLKQISDLKRRVQSREAQSVNAHKVNTTSGQKPKKVEF